MKRTVSVNIKGMNFLIEEDAYELLQNYLDRLTHGLRNEKGNKDIIEDIEMRIAELCSIQLNEKKQVIEIDDIQSILQTLGDPSQYLDEEEVDQQQKSQENTNQQRTDKRLFRDVENASIAGVCAGIANFFNIDITIIRIIFVIMFFAGFGVPLYIILWVVVPKANSTIDKLRMRGKAITVETVRDEVESAAGRLDKKSKSFVNKLRNDDSYSKRFSSLGRLISAIFGTGLITMGLFFLVMFLIFGVAGFQFIPVDSESGFLSFNEFGELVFADATDLKWAWIGAFLAGFSGIFFVLLLGIKMVFRIRNKWSKFTLGGLFTSGFIGTVICIIIGLKTGREMATERGFDREFKGIYAEQLIISSHQKKHPKINGFEVKSNGRNGWIGLKGNNIIKSGIHFQYRLSEDSLFHIHQSLTANSYSPTKALEKARHINHKMTIDSNYVSLNTFYTFPKADKLRDQKVYVIIDIPAGKKVKIDNKIIQLGKDGKSENEVNEFYEEEGFLSGEGEYDHFENDNF